MVYTRRQILGFGGLGAAVTALYTGCRLTAPQQTEQPHTQVTPKTLKLTLEEQLKQTNDVNAVEQLLQQAYSKFLDASNVYQPRINDALSDYAKRSGYNGIDEIVEEDRKRILKPIIDEMNSKPEIAAVMNLNEGYKSQLQQLLIERLDMSRTSRTNKTKFLAGAETPLSFYDPEMILPAHIPTTTPVVLSPLVYQTTSGQKAVLVDMGDGGQKAWLRYESLGEKPGAYAKGLIEKSLQNEKRKAQVIDDLLKKINKPTLSAEESSKLLDSLPEDASSIIYNLGLPSESEGATLLSRDALNKSRTNVLNNIKSLEAWMRM